MRRVVVTGLGVISPIGNTVADFWGNLMAGRSGVARLPSELADRLSVRIAAQVTLVLSERFAAPRLAELDRFSQFALLAAAQALEDADLHVDDHDKTRIGVSIGTGMGGATSVDRAYADLYERRLARIKPSTVLMAMNNAAAAQLSIEHGLQGPTLTYSAACASSSIAIGEAYRLIKHGYADAMLAGGSEALLTCGTIKAWESLRALAVEDVNDPAASCKPFAKDRSGLVLGEGAALLVLEEANAAVRRGARIYAELVGYGCCSDAHHFTQPSVDGTSRAMSLALDDAGLSPSDIDHINAHGTATPIGDEVETLAIKRTFGAHAYAIPVTSTKSMTGHTMGAAGAIECAAAILAIRNRGVPPTAHLNVRDPACDLDYVPNEGRTNVDIRTVMSNSFAFGGSNAVLVVKAMD